MSPPRRAANLPWGRVVAAGSRPFTERPMTAAIKPLPGRGNGSLAAAEDRPVTVPDFLAAKAKGVRLTMLTAYDYTLARLLDGAGVDGLLVGDSLGMVVQGHEHSLGVTLEEVIYHCRIVARGVRRSLLVA